MSEQKKESKVNAAGVTVTNNPIGQSRKWVKLWCEPWLQGTTRYEMSGAQRAFWIDLLALAGASRFPGIISPGQVGGQLLGYPIIWYQEKEPSIDVMATLELFRSTGKIAFTITGENPTSLAVEILNWTKYQSPLDGATRSRDWRNRKKKR